MRTVLSLSLALLLHAPAGVAQDAMRGAVLFSDHCATCHGAGAKGDGPMAAVLSVRPADLTALMAGNGGVFPVERLVRRVDGQDEVLAHGGPMPVFGLILEGPSAVIVAPDGSEVVAPEAIVDIAAWLQMMQE